MINARQKIGFINSFFWCQFRITATLTDSPLRDKDISIKTSNFPWPNMMSLFWLSFISASWYCLISLTTFNFHWDTNNSFRVRCLCFKIPIALLHVFESKVHWLALHLVLQRWLYWREHLKYVWNVHCVATNHRWDLHTTETTGNERFPIGHGTNYFRFTNTNCLIAPAGLPRRHPNVPRVK